MLSVISTLAATAAALGTALSIRLEVPQPPPESAGPSVSVEFRFAETTPSPGLTLVEKDGRTLYLEPDVVVSTGDITCAVQSIDGYSGQPTVNLLLDDAGRQRLAKATTDHVGKILAITVDGALVTAPVIREPILGGGVQISGLLGSAEAKDLAAKLGHPPPLRRSLADTLIEPFHPPQVPPVCFT